MIYMKLPNDGKDAQWGMIELQGDIISQHGKDLHGEYVGDLHYTAKGVPVLIIGHHILTGKEVKLEKPFAILEKRYPNAENGASADDSGNPEYIVRAIITKKLIFKTRPKPIISKVHSTV